MIERRKQEAEAGLVENLARFERRQVKPSAERLEDVGRPASRGERTVAVLDHGQAAGGGDECRRGRHVDRAREIAAGAAAVGEQMIGSLERRAPRERSAIAAPINSSAVSPLTRSATKARPSTARSSGLRRCGSNRPRASARSRSLPVEQAGHGRARRSGVAGAATGRRVSARKVNILRHGIHLKQKKPAGRRAGSR